MADEFKNIGLIGRYRGMGTGVVNTLQALAEYLDKRQHKVFLDLEAAKEMQTQHYPALSLTELGKQCDLIIVVGGDGSLLNAARCAAPFGKAVLGINRGRLGFLTDIHPDHLEEKVEQVLQGNYITESRFLLSTTLEADGKMMQLDNALNDVVLMPGDIPHMIEFMITVNDQFVCKQRADGLIITTPTGSTAYALSGGGPILHPKLDAIALVPMFPHTLSSRPVVIASDSNIEIFITKNNECSPRLSCDGHKRVTIPANSKLHIKKYEKPLTLIHLKDYNYFETLRTKLGWEQHH